MDLKEKRRQELNENKEKRRAEVIEAGLEVFREKGIEASKITEIAERAEVGSASVYRYFSTKQVLVIEASVKYWKDETAELYSKLDFDRFEQLSGLDKVRQLLMVFIELYHFHKPFVRFVEEFDNFVIKEKIEQEDLINYEHNIFFLKDLMCNSIEEGKQQGLIKQTINNDAFYMTITHSLMSLCQKLVLRGNILSSDFDISGEQQISLVIEMALEYLKG